VGGDSERWHHLQAPVTPAERREQIDRALQLEGNLVTRTMVRLMQLPPESL